MRKCFLVATEVTGALVCVAGFRKGRELEFWARPLARLCASLAFGIPFPFPFKRLPRRLLELHFLSKNMEIGKLIVRIRFDDHIHFKYFGRFSLVRLFCGRCHPESVLMEYCNWPCNMRNHIHVFNHHPKKKLFPLTAQVDIAQTISTKHF